MIVTKICEYCQKEFTCRIYPSTDKPDRNRFCSTRCSRLGTPASIEAKQNMSRSGKLRFAREGEREKHSLAAKRFFVDPINLAERVVQINRNWESPAAHLKASESAKKPEATKARKEGRKKCAQNPEWQAAYSKRMSDRLLQQDTRTKSSKSHKQWWAGLTEVEREVQLLAMFEGRRAYLNGVQRTSIEKAVETILYDLELVFIPQHPVDRLVLDFYIPDLGLVIECDGDYWHSLPGAKQRDRRRDYWLQSKGYIVVRLTETDINTDCRKAVLHAIAVRNRVVSLRALRSIGGAL